MDENSHTEDLQRNYVPREQYEELRAQLAEARAEVERLRDTQRVKHLQAAHEERDSALAMCERLAAVLEKVAEVKFGAQTYYEENDMTGLREYYQRLVHNYEQWAREALADFAAFKAGREGK